VKKLIYFLCLFFILFSQKNIIAQEQGAPFIQNYYPLEYGGEPQVWAGVCDSQGRFYNANFEYIFQYTGNKWQKIFAGKDKVVRSLSANNKGLIFAGLDGDFGYLQSDSIGQTIYVSFLNYIDSTDLNFSDVWNTVVDDSTVFFVSRESVFRFHYKDNKVKPDYKVWKAKDAPYVFAYDINKTFYFYHYKKGILKYENDSLVSVKGADELKNYFIWQMFPYKKGKILLATSTGLFIYNPNAKNNEKYVSVLDFDNKELEKTNTFIKENQLYSATQINDSTYAFGTILKGIIIVNQHGKILWNIDKNAGLANNTVHHLYYDKSGILWASTAYGVSKIEFSLPITFWDEKSGLKGSIYSVHRSNGQVYASSNIGVFYLKNNKFYPIKGVTGKDAIQCFDIQTIVDRKKSESKKILVAANGAIYEIENFKTHELGKYSSFGFIPSKDSSKLYFFEDNVLFSVQLSDGKYNFSDTLAVFKGYPTAMSETSNNNLWVIEDDLPVLLSPASGKKYAYKQKHFDKDNLFSKVKFHDILLFNKTNYFIADSAIYMFDKEKSYFKKDTSLFGGVLKSINDKYIFFEEINDSLIMMLLEHNNKNKLAVIHHNKGQYSIDSTVFKRIPQIEAVYTDYPYLWALTVNKLYHIDLTEHFSSPDVKNVLITGVKINEDSLIATNISSTNTPYTIDYNFNNLVFEYSLPFFFNEKSNKYSYRLEGDKHLNKWSSWTKESKKELSNLHEGEYIFYVKSKNIFGKESPVASYRFEILPPWYRTAWAYLFYFIITVLFIWFLIKLNTQRLLKEKEHLEKIVKERTAEIELQKEEIQTQAENLKESNSLLEEKNEEINQQKEEIQAILDNLQEAYESITYMNAELARANEDIKKTNKRMTDSIHYAKRIQFAVLPSENFLKKHFSEYFIFFKPKDIVSGDFYWFRERDNYLLLAVADGTGHGVPGAFISMMGATYLNEITNRTDLNKASDVLNVLRDEVAHMLKTDDDIESRDGMDIAFCALNKETLELQYSGAHHPLYLFREGKFTIIEGDRMPIGVSRRKKDFTNHHIQLKKGDTLYMFSDGFADQFGGEDGRKYLIKRFRQLLKLIHKESMEHQKEVLENEYIVWKGEFDQVDDILIIGLRI
jgi:serine phosphatase RsbU (regulator of sigma subunit)